MKCNVCGFDETTLSLGHFFFGDREVCVCWNCFCKAIGVKPEENFHKPGERIPVDFIGQSVISKSESEYQKKLHDDAVDRMNRAGLDGETEVKRMETNVKAAEEEQNKDENERVLSAFLTLKYMADICRGEIKEIVLDTEAHKYLLQIVKQHGAALKEFAEDRPFEPGTHLFGIKITEDRKKDETPLPPGYKIITSETFVKEQFEWHVGTEPESVSGSIVYDKIHVDFVNRKIIYYGTRTFRKGELQWYY